MNSTIAIQNLRRLYRKINTCVICNIGKDEQKVKRVFDQRAISSKVLIIGQALGSSTQRLSGIPYVYKNGELSRTGARLNEFLKLFGCTVNPKDKSRQYVYSSDIVHCYPGRSKSGSGDRKPDSQEISNCIRQLFIATEIQIVEPNLVLLMGKVSRDTFYRYILKEIRPKSLSKHISEIANNKVLPQYIINKSHIFVLPIQHPSISNPHFKKMMQNDELIQIIREVLK